VLASLCLYPAAHYWANKEQGVPSLQILCLAYALQFALPIITREPTITLAGGVITRLNDEDIIAGLLFSILGVVALGVGYYGFRAAKPARRLPSIALPIDDKKAIIFSLIMGVGIPLAASAEFVSSEQSEQLAVQISAITRVLLNQSLVSIAILSGLVYSGRGGRWHRLLLIAIVAMATIRGISSGFLENAAVPSATLLMMRWHATKRMPVTFITASLLLILFLSPVKHDYRIALSESVAPNMGAGETTLERTWYWFESAAEYWADALTGQQSIRESAESTSSRLDLIHQFAHVRSMTPSAVPYQYGSTYSYFAVALVPRFLWPDKPEAGAANFFYGVNYGITTEEGAKRSSFGISLLAESFINFGVVGIVVIMALQGVFLVTLQVVFAKSGLGGQAVFVAFFVYFLNGIGSSAEIVFGNIFQSMLVSVALLLWVRRSPKRRLRRGYSASASELGRRA
jgi:hypothetical protein